jgi:hypothetical protein
MPVNPKKSKPKPRKVTPKKKTTTTRPQSRKGAKGDSVPPTNRNTNSVRVHIINGGVDGGSAPKYTGPDRGTFAFNPVFDMGFQKALDSPKVSISKPLDVTPLKRVNEIQTQTGIGLGLSTKGLQTEPIMEDWKINPLREMARSIGVPYNKKTSRIQLIEDIKVSIREGKNKKNALMV